MHLRDFFQPEAIRLNLEAASRPAALAEMVALLGVDAPTSVTLTMLLERREQLGSTGVGRGIAIPHCRAPVIPELRVAFGRSPAGISYDAIDGHLVHNIFLIVAPPLEVSNLYLPVLGRLAQFAKGPERTEQLASLTSVDEFLALLDGA